MSEVEWKPTRYQMIMMDPPWPETGGGGRGAQRHYNVIKTKEEILAVIENSGVFMPHENCHMFMWYTNNYLPWALWLMSRLGFQYKTQITWAKESHGTGYYLAGQTEHALFGVRGTLAPQKKMAFSTVLKVADDPSKYRNGHSKKPEEIFNVAETIGYGPRLEMFCRRPRQGWDAWGIDDSVSQNVSVDGKNTKAGFVVRSGSNGLTETIRVS